jgi:hypothetical protein
LHHSLRSHFLIFKNLALIATMTVLKAMSSAPVAGELDVWICLKGSVGMQPPCVSTMFHENLCTVSHCEERSEEAISTRLIN